MSRALIIALHEYRTMLRRRVFQIITIGLPAAGFGVLLVVWIAGVYADDGETTKAGYVDGTGIFTDHRDQGKVEFVPYERRDAGMDDLLSEEIKRLYLIPDDYVEAGVVQRVRVGLDLDLGDDEDRALKRFLLDNITENAPSSALTERLKYPFAPDTVYVDHQGNRQELNQPRVLFSVAMSVLLMLSIAMTGGFMLQGLGEEKEYRVMEVLLSSVTASQLMTGKILGLGGAGLSQMLVWASSGSVILALAPSVLDIDVSLPGAIPTIVAVVVFLLGYVLFATLMSGLGAVAPTTRESQQLSILITIPLIVPIYAWVYIVENPTAAVVKFLTLFPVTSPVVVLQRFGPNAIAAWEVAVSLCLLAAAVVGAMALVARVFRAYLLSYGKRPTLGQLWRAMRQA